MYAEAELAKKIIQNNLIVGYDAVRKSTKLTFFNFSHKLHHVTGYEYVCKKNAMN